MSVAAEVAVYAGGDDQVVAMIRERPPCRGRWYYAGDSRRSCSRPGKLISSAFASDLQSAESSHPFTIAFIL
jgi:hypothetical protein